MDTARVIFARQGYSRTTVKELAQEAGISVGLIFKYFTSKQQLLEAIVVQNDFLPLFRGFCAGTRRKSYRETLKEIISGCHGLLEEKALVFRILIQEAATNPTVYQAWSGLLRESVAMLATHLTEHIGTGELRCRNPEVTARCLFFVLVMMTYTESIFGTGAAGTAEFIDTMLNDILEGIQSPE